VSADRAEPGRRSLLVMLACFAALTLLVVAFSFTAGAWKPRPAQDGPPPEVVAFLGPLARGDRFGSFHVSRLEPARGRMTMEITTDAGERYVVDVHARSAAAPPGIAETPRLAIYLRNEQRNAPTPEAAVRACAALAAALREREEAGHEPPPLEHLAPSPR
jgi:hypothetical protein